MFNFQKLMTLSGLINSQFSQIARSRPIEIDHTGQLNIIKPSKD